MDAQTEKKSRKGSSTTSSAVDSCLRRLLEKKKARLAQSVAHFLQVELNRVPGFTFSGAHFESHNFSTQDQSCTEDDAAALQLPFIHHLMKKVNDRSLSAEEVEEVYTVLSVMPWRPSACSGQLGALCEALWSAREGPLKEERILSSLLRPQCDALVAVYCATALRLQRHQLLTSSPQLQGRGPFNHLRL